MAWINAAGTTLYVLDNFTSQSTQTSPVLLAIECIQDSINHAGDTINENEKHCLSNPIALKSESGRTAGTTSLTLILDDAEHAQRVLEAAFNRTPRPELQFILCYPTLSDGTAPTPSVDGRGDILAPTDGFYELFKGKISAIDRTVTWGDEVVEPITISRTDFITNQKFIHKV